MRNGTVIKIEAGALFTTNVLSGETEYNIKTNKIEVAEIEIRCSNSFEL